MHNNYDKNAYKPDQKKQHALLITNFHDISEH